MPALPRPETSIDRPTLLEPGNHVDPYPLYAGLRDSRRPQRDGILGAWLVARYEQVASLLESPSARPMIGGNGVAPEHLDEAGRERLACIEAALADWLTFLPPASHQRRRRALVRSMSPGLGDGMRRRVETLVTDLLESVESSTSHGPQDTPCVRFDAMQSIAQPLPVLVIGALLGVEDADIARLQSWSRSILEFFDVGSADPVVSVAVMHAALDEMAALVRELIASRRAARQDDLVSRLIEPRGDQPGLEDDEIVASAVQLLFGGHETTRNLIGGGIWSLLCHSAEAERLKADPSRARLVVEECLRWQSPLQLTSRRVVAPMTLQGVTFEEGETVIALLGSANRDLEAYRDAELFDPDRWRPSARASAPRQLAFGRGSHFCLGAALARIEAEIALSLLFRRWPRIELDGEPTWRPSLAFRGPQRLPVRAWLRAPSSTAEGSFRGVH